MIKSIQILRAFAALLVVYAHFEFTKPSIGSFGVDIFFIISGFIMAYIVDKNPSAFLYRRIVRIVPIYFAMTLATILLNLVRPNWFRNVIITPAAVAKSFLFIPYRIKQSGPILSLGWTLNYEMFFYVIIAICIALWGSRKGMVVCLTILVVLVCLGSAYPAENYILNFYSANIILEFVCGSLLYYFGVNFGMGDSRGSRYFFLLLGLASFMFLIYANCYLYTIPMRFWLYGIPALFVTNMALILENKVDLKNWWHRLGVLLGDASYAMYLVHPFVIYAFIRLIFKHVQLDSLVFRFVELIFTMVVVCAVSVVIYKFFEKPLIAKVKLILDRWFDRKIIKKPR
jgi:exopolysaccharide production protein ExoZ